MLRYPLNFSTPHLDDEVALRDMQYYAPMWPDANSMYWWAFTVGYAELGNTTKAASLLTKSSEANVFGPFKIWSEAPGGGGCPNFCTGAGGYLQSLWAGFAGVRFSDDALWIKKPTLPAGIGYEGVKSLLLRHIAYRGSTLDLRVDANGALLSLSSSSSGASGATTETTETTPLPLQLSVVVGAESAQPLVKGAAAVRIPKDAVARVFAVAAS